MPDPIIHAWGLIVFLNVFLVAVSIRWIYALLMFVLMGNAGLQGIDSIGYLQNARDFAEAAVAGSLHGIDWLAQNTGVMPLFAWLLGINALVFHSLAPLTYVLMQGLIDAGTCVLIYRIAQAIDPRYALPAAVLACLNPTQIVLSGLVYTDTPFLFFVAVFLLASVQWLNEPSWRWAIILGLGLGAATMVRVLAAPWVLVLLLFLLFVAIVRKRPAARVIAQLISAAAIFAICISPVLWRNVDKFGTWSLTSQGGLHFAFWVVPLVKESHDGTPWQQSYAAMQKRVDSRYPNGPADPFEGSRRYTEIAREALAELGPLAVAKAWITGAAINVAAPAIILSPPVSSLPRTGFYGTPGASPLQKIENFLFHSDNALYAWILLTGIVGVAIISLVQLCGLVVMVRNRQDWPTVLLFGLWFFYILAVNGPVASPKYRLPIEPVLMVLAGAALSLRRRQSA